MKLRTLLICLVCASALAQPGFERETPRGDITPLSTDVMGKPVSYYLYTPDEWRTHYPELALSAGMTLYGAGDEVVVRNDQIAIIAHEASHVFDIQSGEHDESLEPLCLENPISFVIPFQFDANPNVAYWCQRSEILARYRADVVWSRYCGVGTFWSPRYTLRPFGFYDQPPCLLELDYAEHGYEDAVTYFLTFGPL